MTLAPLFPRQVTGFVHVCGWLNLVAQIVIVGTGGLVRLTSSGLGCPTWPTCTAESLVVTPEMGIHGLVEFGNRLMTFLLVVIAVVTFLSVVRIRSRRDLFWLAITVGLGIPAQAFIGGFSVLTGLNPYIVGLHFVISLGLIVVATLFVQRSIAPPLETGGAGNVWERILVAAVGVSGFVTVLLGILTTGSGPHAGDADAPRNGLSSDVLQHVHSFAGYVMVGATVLLLIALWRRHSEHIRWVIALLVVQCAQLATGIIQANTGLPAFLVGIHMVFACVLASLYTVIAAKERAFSIRGKTQKV